MILKSGTVTFPASKLPIFNHFVLFTFILVSVSLQFPLALLPLLLIIPLGIYTTLFQLDRCQIVFRYLSDQLDVVPGLFVGRPDLLPLCHSRLLFLYFPKLLLPSLFCFTRRVLKIRQNYKVKGQRGNRKNETQDAFMLFQRE